jgi:hypothetical protein
MKSFFIFLSFFSVHLLALNIQVSESSNHNISSLDIEKTVALWQKRNLRIDDQEAKKLVLENRVLADAFLKNGNLNDAIKVENQIVYEEQLADIFVQNELKKIDNIEIPLSYYENNKHEFFVLADIKFKVYAFKAFEEALDCYNKNKNDISLLDAYATEHNTTVEEHTMSLKQLHPQLQNLLIDFETKGYIAPPQKFFTNYIVFEVVDIIKAHLQPFEEVKASIQTKLKKKIMNQKRDELLEQYLYKAIKK